MTTIERKKRLKFQIDLSNDEILNKIEKILEEQDVYQLSKEQISAVKGAEEEYERGECTTAEEEQKDIEEWFLAQEK